MAFPTFTSLQKWGFGIAVFSVIALKASFNEAELTENDLATMEGKVVKVTYIRPDNTPGQGGSNKISSLDCEFDTGRKFYLSTSFLINISAGELGKKMKSDSTTKIWYKKNDSDWESLEVWQLSSNDVTYIDYKKNQSRLGDNFWFFGFTLVLGIVFMFFTVVRNSVIRSNKVV